MGELLQDGVGGAPWVWSDVDAERNALTLTVLPTPDGYIADAHSYRDTGHPASGVVLDRQVLDVPEGSVLQNAGLARLGYRTMAQLRAAEVSTHDVPTAPVMDLGGQS